MLSKYISSHASPQAKGPRVAEQGMQQGSALTLNANPTQRNQGNQWPLIPGRLKPTSMQPAISRLMKFPWAF